MHIEFDIPACFIDDAAAMVAEQDERDRVSLSVPTLLIDMATRNAFDYAATWEKRAHSAFEHGCDGCLDAIADAENEMSYAAFLSGLAEWSESFAAAVAVKVEELRAARPDAVTTAQ